MQQKQTKQHPWLLLHKKTIPTDRLQQVGEVSAKFLGYSGVAWSAQRPLTAVNLGFLDWNRYISLKYYLSYPHKTEWISFQTQYFSEIQEATKIEPGTSGSVATRLQRLSV
jgi:hypothetical protein